MFYRKQRDKAINETYYSLLHSGEINPSMSIKSMMTKIAEQPAPSFYLDEETAILYIYMYERCQHLKTPNGRRKQDDLYRTFKRLSAEHPELGRYELMRMSASQPAPHFYLNAKQVQRIIYGK